MATVQFDIRDEAKRIIDQMPPQATWQDLIYQLYVRQRLDEGIRDLEEGRTLTTEELRRDLGRL